MEPEDFMKGIFIFLGIVVLILILSIPISGNIFGYEVKMPIMAWLSIGAFVVLAFALYFKHRS